MKASAAAAVQAPCFTMANFGNFHPKIPASVLTLDSTNLIGFQKFKVMVKVNDIYIFFIVQFLEFEQYCGRQSQN